MADQQLLQHFLHSMQSLRRESNRMWKSLREPSHPKGSAVNYSDCQGRTSADLCTAWGRWHGSKAAVCNTGRVAWPMARMRRHPAYPTADISAALTVPPSTPASAQGASTMAALPPPTTSYIVLSP